MTVRPGRRGRSLPPAARLSPLADRLVATRTHSHLSSVNIQVHKFGGAALADGAAVLRAAEIIARRQPDPCVVVTSALAGVTDALFTLAAAAAGGDPTY